MKTPAEQAIANFAAALPLAVLTAMCWLGYAAARVPRERPPWWLTAGINPWKWRTFVLSLVPLVATVGTGIVLWGLVGTMWPDASRAAAWVIGIPTLVGVVYFFLADMVPLPGAVPDWIKEHDRRQARRRDRDQREYEEHLKHQSERG